MKRIATLCALLVAAPAAAEFPQAQKEEIGARLLAPLEKATIVMYRLSTDARNQIGRSIPQDVAAHQKVADAWLKNFDALLWLLDLDNRLAVPRAQLQAEAFARIDSALALYQQAVPLVDAVLALCSSNCAHLINAQMNLAQAIVLLQAFDRALDYTMDPRSAEVIAFPGVTRSSAPLVPPHGDWDTYGLVTASAGRNAIAASKKEMEALLDNEAIANTEAYWEHNSNEAARIVAVSAALMTGIEQGGVKGAVDTIFSGMTTTRTRQFARGMLGLEMDLAAGTDDSQLDVNGRLPHRGIAYLLTQACRNGLSVVLTDATLSAHSRDLVESAKLVCDTWSASDSQAFNQVVFRDFNAAGPPPFDCAAKCGTSGPVDGSVFCAPGTSWDGALCRAIPPPPCPTYELQFVPSDSVSGLVRCVEVPQ